MTNSSFKSKRKELDEEIGGNEALELTMTSPSIYVYK
jgi:hypothetical protein